MVKRLLPRTQRQLLLQRPVHRLQRFLPHLQVTIDSDLGGGDAATVVLTNRERPAGASPYPDQRRPELDQDLQRRLRGVATVAYNIYGKRVFAWARTDWATSTRCRSAS